MKNLEILAVWATAKSHLLLSGDVPHRKAATREQMVADWRRLRVRDRKRAEQIQGRSADCQILAVRVEQDIVTDAKLDIAMSRINPSGHQPRL